MVNLGSARVGRLALGVLWSAAVVLFSSTGGAVPVTSYVTVQPIDVCATTVAGNPSGCAPVNQSGDTFVNAPGTIKIGFVDPKSNINITDALFNQIGVDVTFLPLVPLVSPGNLSLTVTSCAPSGTDCQSPQFQVLSQQVPSNNPPPTAISQGATPTPPRNPNPTTINMFFVNALRPPTNQPGNLYGLGWINNNGIAVSSNTLLGGTAARPDTLAHEIGHNLDLDHNTFGAGPAVPQNLETAGGSMGVNLRLEPNPAIVNGQAAWINQVYPTGAPNPPPLDQLTLGITGSQTQQGQVLLSPFLNPIPLVDTPASGNTFSVSFVNGGRPGEHLDRLTLTGPAGFTFDPGTIFNLVSNPNGLIVNSSFSSCGAAGCSDLVLDFTSGSQFIKGDSIEYTLCVEQDDTCVPVSVDDLAGGTYTYLFETDQQVGESSVPVELFQTTSQLLGPGDLFSDSQDPDLSIPSEILNPLTFVGFFTTPCTPISGVDGCPLNLADASPLEEGGQPMPEPPATPIFVLGIGLLLFLYYRRKLAEKEEEPAVG
jgi:hypothetical protein